MGYDHLYYELKRAQIPGHCALCGRKLGNRRRKWCDDKCRDKAEELLWKNISYKHLHRTDRHCENCGIKDFDTVVHHKIPILDEGGTSEDYNLIVLCPRCHGAAHMRLQTHQKAKRERKLLMAQDPRNARIEDFIET